MIIAEEKLADLKYQETMVLFEEHWNELALHKGSRPLDIDFAKLLQLNNIGIMVCFTARDEGKLVGYASFMVDWHPRYKTWKMASNDTVFLTKRYRRRKGVVVQFFTEIEALLKAKGVHSIIYFDKIHASRESVFTHFGYKPIEQVYEKVI